MSMSHPDREPPSSIIHGELRGQIHHPVMPPMPPLPPPNAGIELLRDTVEVQARTIRYLLANYEALLRKVEHDEKFKSTVVYSVGPNQTFAANANVPTGWWIIVTSGDHSIHFTIGSTTGSKEFSAGQAIFSNGSYHVTSGSLILAPIHTEVTVVEVE